MRVYLTENKNAELRGDLILTLIKRTDLTPIPSTIEMVARANNDIMPFLEQGKIIAVGDESVRYKIVFKAILTPKGTKANGNPNYDIIKVIALLEGAYELAFLKDRAIIKENTSLGSVFKACGGKFAIKKDIKIDRFNCLIGEYPSFSFMRALGKHAATIHWDGKNSIEFLRLKDLFTQKPIEQIPIASTQEVQSGFIERHETPAYYSNAKNGAIIKSKAKQGRRSLYEMFADSQILNNLSTYLLIKRIWTTDLTVNINAGDLLEVENESYVVVTATHALTKVDSGSGGGLSRFWLAQISKTFSKA